MIAIATCFRKIPMQSMMIVLGRLAVAASVWALFVPPAAAGVRYRVEGQSETTTISMPDPIAANRGPSEPGRPAPPPPSPKRTTSGPLRTSADVLVEGANIRIDNFRLDPRQNSAHEEFFISTDAGASFEIVNLARVTRTRFPFEVSLAPNVMPMRSFSGRLAPAITDLEMKRGASAAGGVIGGYDTVLHSVRVSFGVPENNAFRRPPMKVTAEIKVWMTSGVPARIPPGLQAWATGFAAADAALLRTMHDVEGFPMRTVTRLRMDSRRDQMTTVSTLEVKDITIEEIPPALFEVPSH